MKLSSSERDSKGRSLEAVGYLRIGGFDPELLNGDSVSWVRAAVCWDAEGRGAFGNLESIPSLRVITKGGRDGNKGEEGEEERREKRRGGRRGDTGGRRGGRKERREKRRDGRKERREEGEEEGRRGERK